MHRYSNFQAILQPADIAVSGDRGDDSLPIDFPYPVVVPVRNIKVACLIKGHAIGTFQLRTGGGSPVSTVTGHSRPRHTNDNSFLVYLADSVAGFFSDKQFSVRAEGQPSR